MHSRSGLNLRLRTEENRRLQSTLCPDSHQTTIPTLGRRCNNYFNFCGFNSKLNSVGNLTWRLCNDILFRRFTKWTLITTLGTFFLGKTVTSAAYTERWMIGCPEMQIPALVGHILPRFFFLSFCIQAGTWTRYKGSVRCTDHRHMSKRFQELQPDTNCDIKLEGSHGIKLLFLSAIVPCPNLNYNGAATAGIPYSPLP